MTLEYLHTIGRIILTLVIVFKLTQLRYTVNIAERVGLGFMGAGSFLTISVIWERQRSPFDGWAGLLLTFGAIAFIVGRTYRDLKHQRANHVSNREAERYLVSRGKL